MTGFHRICTVLYNMGVTDYFGAQSVKIDRIERNPVKRNSLFAVVVFICFFYASVDL